jgi:hypothetical protein
MGSGGIIPPLLTSALDSGGQRHGQTHYPGERAPATHSRGGWVGSRDSLDAVEKRKILSMPGIEPWPSNL